MGHVTHITSNSADVYGTANTDAAIEAGSAASTAASAGSTADGYGESLLPSPAGISGDPIAEISILLAQMALDDSKSARSEARLDDQRAVSAGLARVNALREKADYAYMSAIVNAGVQMAGGAAQIGGLFADGETAQALTASAKAFEGAGKIFGAISDHDAALADADAAKWEVVAGSATRAHDAARADAQSAQQLYDRFVQSYRELVQTRSASLLAAVRG